MTLSVSAPLTAKEKTASQIYEGFLKTSFLLHSRLTAILWRAVWKLSHLFLGKCRVEIKLHGKTARLPFGHSYPVHLKTVPAFNHPLIDLTAQTHFSSGRPIVIADIGAGTGDTLLLLSEHCRGMFLGFYAIDGDAEFLEYARYNLKDLPDGHLIEAFLSAGEGEAPELVRQHPGTASAQGKSGRTSQTLDSLLGGAGIDLLKVDADGYDGQILSGAFRVLSQSRPSVIFEWHPKLYRKTGNDFHVPFEALKRAGYERFFFYTKLGEFSGMMENPEPEQLKEKIQECLRRRDDWHYDIVSLHRESRVLPGFLTGMKSL